MTVLKSKKEKKSRENVQMAYNAGANLVDNQYAPSMYTPTQESNYEYESGAAQREKHHIKAPVDAGKRITLKIVCNNSPERVVNTTIIDKITIGRSEKCDVYLDDMKMSRTHFEIINKNGEFFVNDLGSVNGTLVNKMKISTKRKLNSNDEIIAGHSNFRIVF